MPKKIPLQGGKPIQGSDTLNITKKNNNSNIPADVIQRLEYEVDGVDFGGVSLIVSIRDGYPAFRIEKTISILPGRALK